jgi:DNA-binding winged helix-turn-helix (wHTH) protein
MTGAAPHLQANMVAVVFSFDEYELDAEALELRHAGKLVHADAMVLRLLACLVKNAGRLVTKDELVDDVWEGRAIADNAITVSVARLRKLLGHKRGAHEVVVTTYGRGYRFVPPVVQRDARSDRPAGAAHGGERPGHPILVGREVVLEQLRRALDAARGQRGMVCVLMGEPGIGKTSVAEAFARELAGTDVRVAWGFCREAGDTPPLWPWQRLLAEISADAPAREPEAPITTDWQGPTRHRASSRS